MDTAFTTEPRKRISCELLCDGVPVVTRQALPSSIAVEDDVAYVQDEQAHVAFVMAPDDILVQFVENPSMTGPIALHHVHFHTPDAEKMQAWYADVFRARAGMRGGSHVGDLPAGHLRFSRTDSKVVPTRYRALDHIGFDIEDLRAFCEGLTAKGIALDSEYRDIPDPKLGNCFVTDPWGVRIDLTEGLDAY